ncbi:MAG: HDOD domain-containing protein [Oscillospiraceae bacterium]|nr:HDOD domain-containing protein [Oscillospiraceae bacterium]
MSSKYIVRQPIKDAENKIIGYEILYYGENQAFSNEGSGSGAANEFAAADTLYNFLTQNTSKALKGSLNFMTFTTTLLMKKTPKLFDKSELVIQIDDSVIIHPLSMHFVQQYAKAGYKIAVNEFQFAPRYLSLMDSIDYIKVNAKTTNDISMHNIIEIARNMNKKCIATNIDSEELYRKVRSMGVDAMEGSYVAERLTTRAHSSAYLQGNFFRLMVAVTCDEPNVEEIENMISADATLSYGILKMANSVYFALRHRATTIHQAIMTLGLGQLRQWIYLLSASNADAELDASAEEFLKLSFMRANFSSELMNYAKEMPISKSEAYLMGMFSTLNYLIDAPLEDILSEIPVADEVREALLHQTGRCGKLYKLVLSYEAADWQAITTMAEELGIPNNLLTSVYFICMENVNMLWEQLTNPTPDQIVDEEPQETSNEPPKD